MNTSTDTSRPSPALRTVTDLLATLDRMRDEGHPARERLAYALDHAPDVGAAFDFEDAYAHEARESNRRLEKLDLVVKAITELKGTWADSPLDARAREAGLALMGHLDQVVESQRRHEQLTEREMLSSIWGWAPDLRELYPWLTGGSPGTPSPTGVRTSNHRPAAVNTMSGFADAQPEQGQGQPEQNQLVAEVERLAVAAHEENLATIELARPFGEPEAVGVPEPAMTVLPPAPGDGCPPQVFHGTHEPSSEPVGTIQAYTARRSEQEAQFRQKELDALDAADWARQKEQESLDQSDGLAHAAERASITQAEPGEDAFHIQAWTEALSEQFATNWKFDLREKDPLSAALVAWQWSRYEQYSSDREYPGLPASHLNNVRLVVMPRPDGKLSVLLRVIHAGHIERTSTTLDPAEVDALHADPRAFVKTLKPG
jgi:hypothetical protein